VRKRRRGGVRRGRGRGEGAGRVEMVVGQEGIGGESMIGSEGGGGHGGEGRVKKEGWEVRGVDVERQIGVGGGW